MVSRYVDTRQPWAKSFLSWAMTLSCMSGIWSLIDWNLLKYPRTSNVVLQRAKHYWWFRKVLIYTSGNLGGNSIISIVSSFASFIYPTALLVVRRPELSQHLLSPSLQQLLTCILVHKLSCYPREYVVSGGPPVWTPRIWLSSQQGLHLRNSQLLIDFILSPTISGVFFVITLALDESGKLTVYEICDGEIAATYIMEDRIYSDPRTSERGLLRWEKLNSFGGYCLVQVIQEPSTTTDDARGEACPCGRRSRQLVSLCFNIYTKSFTTLRHHLSELSPWISHVWNNRLFIMDDQFHRRQTASNRRPVMSLGPCTEVDTPREKAASVPMYTTMHENMPLIYRRRRMPFDTGDMGERLNIELGLDVLQEFSPHPTWKDSFIPSPSEINPGKLVGDDDFFIFVNSPSYTVLSFGEGFPTKHPTMNESKHWWRRSRGKDSLR